MVAYRVCGRCIGDRPGDARASPIPRTRGPAELDAVARAVRRGGPPRRAATPRGRRYRVRSLLVNPAARAALDAMLSRRDSGAVPLRSTCAPAEALRGDRRGSTSTAGAWRWPNVRRPPASSRWSHGALAHGGARRGHQCRQRRRRVPQRGGLRRRRRAAQPYMLRSALPQGHPHLDGRHAARAVRQDVRLAGGAARAPRTRASRSSR